MRAVLETATGPTAEGEPAVVPRVRLSLLAPSVACRVEVDDAGEPRVYVGRPGSGVTAVLSHDGLDLWAGGNVVASVRAGRAVAQHHAIVRAVDGHPPRTASLSASLPPRAPAAGP